jgi:hypothetical protein
MPRDKRPSNFTTARSKLRARAIELARTAYSISLLRGAVTREERQRHRETVRKISAAVKYDLRDYVRRCEERLAEERQRYGINCANALFLHFLDEFETRPDPKRYPMLAKYDLDKVFPKNSPYRGLPDHAKIYIRDDRPSGVRGKVDWFVLEIAIYEEMCALFNLTRRDYRLSGGTGTSRIKIKTAQALYHSAASMAYYFIEAYLNNLAFSIILTRDNLSPKDYSLLAEWDGVKKREKPLSLREKVLQYPRIARAAPHPPIQESNCPELKFLLESAKSIRDAVAHPTARPKQGNHFSDKEFAFLTIGEKELEAIVDNAISLVRRVETETRGERRAGLIWLRDRDESGLFPDSVFA